MADFQTRFRNLDSHKSYGTSSQLDEYIWHSTTDFDLKIKLLKQAMKYAGETHTVLPRNLF